MLGPTELTWWFRVNSGLGQCSVRRNRAWLCGLPFYDKTLISTYMYTLLHPISSAGSPVQLTVTSLPWRNDSNVGDTDSYPVFWRWHRELSRWPTQDDPLCIFLVWALAYIKGPDRCATIKQNAPKSAPPSLIRRDKMLAESDPEKAERNAISFAEHSSLAEILRDLVQR